MIVVHCPRCNWSEWRFVEYTGASSVYECCHCGAMMAPQHWEKLAQMERRAQTSQLIKSTLDDMADDVVKHLRDARIAGMFDGEDSQ